MSASSHASAPAPEDDANRLSALGSPPPRTAVEEHDTTTEEEREREDRHPVAGREEGDAGSEQSDVEEGQQASVPPLPDEVPPPLPDEARPGQGEDDGWEPVWDPNAQAYYFYNRFTGVSQWENPRVPNAAAPGVQGGNHDVPERKSPVVGGYNPAVHGDYDPTAPYAQQYEEQAGSESSAAAQGQTAAYGATGMFNRFTGRWQAASITPENHNDENKSRRQMNAFFDVDSAANSHDGRSLRAERSAKKLSKKELKMFKEKRREKKEEKRRAWLRD